MATHTNYLYRMTTIFAITTLSPAVNAEVLKEYIIPTIAKLSTDPIPNIRFNVAKSLEVLVGIIKTKPELASMLIEMIKPNLTKMSEDGDMDVRYYSQKALMAF